MSSTRKEKGENKPRGAEKKLQRLEKLRQYGVDLPDIPGLPVEVIPLHVHAVKVTAKLFGKSGAYASKTLYRRDDERNERQRQAVSARKDEEGSLLQNIMHRVEKATRNNVSTTEEQKRTENEIQRKYQDGTQAWLIAIHRCVKDKKSRQMREASEDSSSYSVPVSALQHLWSIGLDHARYSVRRATQHLAGMLLGKSADCRSWWLHTDEEDGFPSRRREKASVIVWMDHVLAASAGNEELEGSHRLWQLEALDLLQHLEHNGYGGLYPTLISAIQRFQQKCPVHVLNLEDSYNMVEGKSTQAKSMATLRLLRDTAMERWEEMDRKVQKLIRKAKKCFDVLVPRVDGSVSVQPSARTEDFEEDDDDIDWEEGLDDSGTEINGFVNDDIAHADAVERTLEIMKNTGGMYEGRLEVSVFLKDEEKNDFHISDTDAESRPQHTEIKKTLDQVIRILSVNYMPRLSAWSQALAMADSLKAKNVGKKTDDDDRHTMSLIQMTEVEQACRSAVLQSCLEVRQELAHILQAAKRLGVELQESHASDQAAPPSISAPPLRSSRAPIGFARRKRVLQNRSTPLQIKFAKR
ncbi:hypothetical protein FisN_6Lh298 [Fistulifera solaris]|uniref:Uncharacterized protein n=1 Tax=Fistulifera solaris TaxID=1519565 RepID=A0A1Z5J5R9_FISSO|nr:hypothetical protein FisN_6Lh298 [Fistulifera solaris]|eukprot:GAX09333.1 hypothetical protein FisN_6Lh298 [Fistulifera solaris]